MTRRRRAAALLGLALLLGVLAASDVAGRERALRDQLGPAVRVLVARSALSPGQRITAGALGQREVPERYAPRGALRDAQDAIGKRAAVAVAAGAYLDPAFLDFPGEREREAARPPLEGDQRALDVVAVGGADAIDPGTRVDVLVTGSGSTRLVLAGPTVLAARPAPADAQGDLPRVLATLRVTVREAVTLTAAIASAREVRLLPRPSAAGGARETPPRPRGR
jgi:pilus assembly protein CpaB